MKTLPAVTGALALCLLHVSAHSFGPVGHMAIGSIADQMLAGTAAGKRARSILGSNLRTASVWADCAKGVSTATFKYGGRGQYPECAVYENPASEKQMEAYVKRNVGNCAVSSNTEACHKQYHYTDIATDRDSYVAGDVGTTGHDIVAVIRACIDVLKDRPSPEPFRIGSKKEALRLLAHFVGDIHQPLHVVSVYLDRDGNVVSPKKETFDPKTETRGGNDLLAGGKKLHAMWDSVSGAVSADTIAPSILQAATSMPTTVGSVESWSSTWATEIVPVAKQAFAGLTYSKEDQANHHKVTLPPNYAKTRTAIQKEQVAKAGARLAHILKDIWGE